MSDAQANDDLAADAAAYVDLLPAPWRARLTTYRPVSEWRAVAGYRLHLASWRPDRPARARLIVLHGAGGHAAALWPLAALGAAAGFEVLVPDLPGYGRTQVPPGRVARYQDWIEVGTAVLAAAAADQPTVVFGASMGGRLGYDVVARHGGAAHLLATCLLDPADPGTWPALMRWGGAWGMRIARPLLDAAGAVVDRWRVPIRWLTPMRLIANTPEAVDTCLRDRRGGGNRVALGFVSSFLRAPPLVRPEVFRCCPVSLVHPAEDRWTPVSMSLSFVDRLAAPKRLVLLPDGGHLPVEAAALAALESEFRQVWSAVAGAAP